MARTEWPTWLLIPAVYGLWFAALYWAQTLGLVATTLLLILSCAWYMSLQHELVHGQRAMSPDTAIRCALHFGVPATTWLALQADWDSYHAWKALRREALAAGALSALVLHSGGLPRTPRQAAHAALA